MIDSSQARRSHHNDGEPHTFQKVQPIDGFRDRHMQTACSFHDQQIVLPAQSTKGLQDGRDPDRPSFFPRGRERRHREPEDIGTDLCYRIMIARRLPQASAIGLSLGRSCNPGLNRLHHADVDSPLPQMRHQGSSHKRFSNARIGRSDEDPSRARLARCGCSSSHIWNPADY